MLKICPLGEFMPGMLRHTAVKLLTGVVSLPWWISAAFAFLAYVLCVTAPQILQFEHPFFAGLDAAVQALPARAPIAAGVFAAISLMNIVYALKFRRIISDPPEFKKHRSFNGARVGVVGGRRIPAFKLCG